MGGVRRCGRAVLAIGVSLLATLVISESASAGAFQLSTYQPQKKTRVTSSGLLWVDNNCPDCKGKVTVSQAGTGAVFGIGYLKDQSLDYGVPVDLKKPAIKAIEKAKKPLKIKIEATATGGQNTGEDSLTAKVLPALDFADPCGVITAPEIDFILATPGSAPSPIPEASEPDIDEFSCGFLAADFSAAFNILTTRGDFAYENFARPSIIYETMVSVPGPWDDAVLYDNAGDTSRVFQARRGDDLLTMGISDEQTDRAIAVASQILDDYPG